MINQVAAFCARRPRVIVALALVAAIAGEWARRRLVRDAIPDLADPRIVLAVEWMDHPAAEVSARITDRLTAALDNVPNRVAVRGTSMMGMGFVDVVFGARADLARGRVDIATQVARVRGRLPDGASVKIGPTASSTGWVFQYAVVDRRGLSSLALLRQLHEELVRPALISLSGVVEVATVGDGTEQFLIEANRDRLRATGLALTDLVAPLRAAAKSPGRVIARDIEALPIQAATGAGETARHKMADVARVGWVADRPIGIADLGGSLPALGGIVIAGNGADPAGVAARAGEALDGVRAHLPSGTEIVTICDRSTLASHMEGTLLRALTEEIAVVAAVVLIFLVDVRSALVPLLTLPLVLMLTFAGMRFFGISATVMSFGGIGIALGMAMDADIVALEACHRHLETHDGGRDRGLRLAAAASTFMPAVLTSLLIAGVAFLPVLAFTGESGRLLGPLAGAKTLVIAAAALVSLTVAPILRDRLLPGRVAAEFSNPLTRGLVRIYGPFVHFALRQPLPTLATAGLALLSCLPLLPRLGGEFFPRVDEGDLLFMPTTGPGVMFEEAASQLRQQDAAIARFGEVEVVLGKVGRADTATDPAPFSMVETTIHLKPRSEWPRRPRSRWYSDIAPRPLLPLLRALWPEVRPATTPELIDELDRATRMPGWTAAWTSPVRARMDMMSTGARTPVAIRVAGVDLTRSQALAQTVRSIVERVPGTRSAVAESQDGETWPVFVPDSANPAHLEIDQRSLDTALDLGLSGGLVAMAPNPGSVRDLPWRLRFDSPLVRPVDRLLQITVPARGGTSAKGDAPATMPLTRPVPLGLLGHAAFVQRPAVVHSARGQSVAYVYVDLDEHTDVVRYLTAAGQASDRARASGELRLDAGETLAWAGQHELLTAAQKRLKVVVPLVILTMVLLLFLQFRSFAETLVVLSSVPFALVGSVWTLFILDYHLSAPVWVGMLSVIGLAMQTGVVMVVYIDEAFYRRVREGRIRTRDDIVAAHAEGSILRLRPKIMTITTMSAGLLPMLWTDGVGAEIMRRVAAPMLGGLLTSAFLTLEILPVLYTIWRHQQLRRAQRTGRPLIDVIGRAAT